MSTAGWISAAVLGLFYACCGWNKIFDERRAASMRHTMHRYLPWPDHRLWYWFVSSSELILGLMLLLPFLLFLLPEAAEHHIWAANKVAATGLYVVSAVAFMLVGWKQVLTDYQPYGCIDWTSCLLYKTEILLMIIAVMVIAS
jgi:hypothetical protein